MALAVDEAEAATQQNRKAADRARSSDGSTSARQPAPGQRLRSVADLLAWFLVGSSAAAVVFALVLGERWSLPVPYQVSLGATYPLVGALIVHRQRRNAVGWLLLAIGANAAIGAVASVWAPVALDLEPGFLPGGLRAGQVAIWMSDGLWIPGHGLLLTFLPLLFPTGRLPSRRWLPVGVFAAGAVALHTAAPLTVLPQIWLRTSTDAFYPDERLAALLGGHGYRLTLAAAVVCTASLVWRIRSMPPAERGSYLWFAVGITVVVGLVLPQNLLPHSELARQVALLSMPAGAAVAILRHRAYGIDVVVNRTLVYATLSVVLAGVYLGAAVFVDALVTSSGPWSTMVAAGATALVLGSLRDRVQVGVDRLLYGRRHDPHLLASTVGNRLEAVTGNTDVLTTVTADIARLLRLPYVALEVVDLGDNGRHRDAYRILAQTGGESPLVTERVALVVNGTEVGRLVAGLRRGQPSLSTADLAALRSVAPLAATAVRQVQLTDDLRRSRERLALALEEERRRIRRDLHDGLGPSLATVVMGLEEARAVHTTDGERTGRLLVDLKEQTKEAIEEIRSLVYGLRPPALDELGLVAAVAQLVSATTGRTQIAIETDLPNDLPGLSAATEVCAYRVVQESVTNVVRHSGATTAQVGLSVEAGALRVEVRDDGRGLPDAFVAGVGFTSMRERVEDIGGTIEISSRSGVSVVARLPLGPE